MDYLQLSVSSLGWRSCKPWLATLLCICITSTSDSEFARKLAVLKLSSLYYVYWPIGLAVHEKGIAAAKKKFYDDTSPKHP